MKKPIIILIAVILIALLAYALMGKEPADVSQTEETVTASSSEVRGTVMNVNADQVPVDGPTLITIRQADDSQAVIAIPSMGINLCPAQANIADISLIKAGGTVEAKGQAGAEGMIIPCESADHYLKIIGQ
ncbi:MAG TPA: hypothetical protein VEB60_01265 [Candidatus Paceibacterota bacterium]|nr:hypothetical protein [Candidatus Paceibacterota bacterium]